MHILLQFAVSKLSHSQIQQTPQHGVKQYSFVNNSVDILCISLKHIIMHV